MKILLQNAHMPSRAITILVQDRLKALAKLRPIRAANLHIQHGALDALSYQIRLELHLDGQPLTAHAESPSFRAAFDRVLLQLQSLLLRRPLTRHSISKRFS